jgi:prepilin-type N-terminal cleavage/methylation domain-containing protein
MQTIFKKLIRRDSGFTLVELSVAMLISGVLGGVAVPSYLGMRNNAYDFEAQSGVNSALLAAQVHYSTGGTFSDSSASCSGATNLATEMQSVEPNFAFVVNTVSSTGPRVVSVEAQPTYSANYRDLGCQAFYAAVLSQSGTCWIGRLTVEGKYLSATPDSTNILELNGNAYASIETPTQCSASTQTSNTGAQPFFDTWRSITAP